MELYERVNQDIKSCRQQSPLLRGHHSREAPAVDGRLNLCGWEAASLAALVEGGVSIPLAASYGQVLKLARAFLLHVTHVAELIFLKQSC